ncbi:MAG: competence/damage-inducible protein A [Burkholderiales bacterium]|nr:competence/damage-inducible protein A [Burkholderiales bacterium]
MRSFGTLIIGDEILTGKRQDKHFAQVIGVLKARGLELSWAEYLGDDPQRITATLRRTLTSDDVVFSFGGIGATPDDHTRQCAAAAANVGLRRHPEAVREIESRFGPAAYPKRILMAEFPQGSRIVPNPFNRIAGFSLGHHYFLPGFPEMAWPMMEWVLDTLYRDLHHALPQAEQTIVVDAMPESDIIDAMNAVLARFDGVKVSSLPRFTSTGREVELSVRGDPEQVPAAMAIIKNAVDLLGYCYESPAKS